MSLFRAILEHRTQFVINAFNKNKGLNPNKKNKKGNTLLQVAAREGLWEVVLLLLAKGATLDTTALQAALQGPKDIAHEIVIQILFACGATAPSLNLPSFKINPHIFRALIFSAINHFKPEEGARLLLLLQPQIKFLQLNSDEFSIQLEEEKYPQYSFRDEIGSFLELAVQQKSPLATDLIAIAKNLQAKFQNVNVIVTIREIRSPAQRLTDAYNRKDYLALSKLFSEIDNKTLFSSALQKDDFDLAVFILISSQVNAYQFALTVMDNDVIFNKLLTFLKGPDLLLGHLVNRDLALNAHLSKQELQLFHLIPQSMAKKIDAVLIALDKRRPNSQAKTLLIQNGESINERMQGMSLPLSQHSLLLKTFSQFGIYVFEPPQLKLSGEKIIPKTAWHIALSYLDKEEKKLAHPTSRFFHQLMTDPREVRKRQGLLLQRRLKTVDSFISTAEGDLETIQAQERQTRKYSYIAMTLTFMALGVCIWQTVEARKELNAINDKIEDLNFTHQLCYPSAASQCAKTPSCEDACNTFNSSQNKVLYFFLADLLEFALAIVLYINRSSSNPSLASLSDYAQYQAKMMLIENPIRFSLSEKIMFPEDDQSHFNEKLLEASDAHLILQKAHNLKSSLEKQIAEVLPAELADELKREELREKSINTRPSMFREMNGNISLKQPLSIEDNKTKLPAAPGQLRRIPS